MSKDAGAVFSWINLVQEEIPGTDEETANNYLWNLTCFPFGTEAQVREQLREVREKGADVVAEEIWESMGRALAEMQAEGATP